MAGLVLSDSEKRYLIDGIKHGMRLDGRGRLDYRQMELETGVVDTANGSARLRLAGTDVLVTVKMEIEAPDMNQPNLGKLQFFVNCSAIATPEFDGRGGEELAQRLQGILERLYASSKVFDRSSLVVVPGKHVKAFYVDIEILQCGGNLFDLVSLGVKSALFATKTPQIFISGEDAGELEFSVSDNPNKVDRIDVSNAPLLITHLRVTENVTVVDPTLEEECCGAMRIVFGVTPNGNITVSEQLGAGSIAIPTLKSCLQSARKLGLEIHRRLISKLNEEESNVNRRIRGFLL